jgi:hypothetical protein
LQHAAQNLHKYNTYNKYLKTNEIGAEVQDEALDASGGIRPGYSPDSVSGM